LDEIEITSPEKRVARLLDFQKCLFQYKNSPDEFFESELPDWKKRKYQVLVKAKDELVEISILRPKPSDIPACRWLFDLSKNGMAVYSCQFGRINESEFEKVEGSWLPKFEINKSSVDYQETRFFDLVINPELDSEEFTVKSIPVRDGKVHVLDRRSRKSVPFNDFKN